MDELGGPGVHGRNGVCQLVGRRRFAEAVARRRELLSFLPRAGSATPVRPTAPLPPNGDDPAAAGSRPSRAGSTTSAT